MGARVALVLVSTLRSPHKLTHAPRDALLASHCPMPDEEATPFALALCTVVVVPWALLKLRAAMRVSEEKKWRNMGFSATAQVVHKEKRLAGSWSNRLTWSNALFGAAGPAHAILYASAHSGQAACKHSPKQGLSLIHI